MPPDILTLLRDPRLEFQPSNLKCTETIERDGEVGDVTFAWTINSSSENDNDNDQQHTLSVSCRGRSVGVLTSTEPAVEDDELNEEAVDDHFFDPGYTLAGRTGFQIWAGSRLLIESLTPGSNVRLLDTSPFATLQSWKHRIQAGARILELGAGTGVAGLSLAAVGAQVVLTDLPTLVDNATRPNVERNAVTKNDRVSHATSSCGKNDEETMTTYASSTECHWMQETRPLMVGQGKAGTAALDWTRPLSPAVQLMAPHIDLIIACDCVWLRSMLNSLLDTVAALCQSSNKSTGYSGECPKLFLSFQRRDNGSETLSVDTENSMFTTVEGVVQAIQSRQWTVECLAWRKVALDGKESDKEVFILAIQPVAEGG